MAGIWNRWDHPVHGGRGGEGEGRKGECSLGIDKVFFGVLMGRGGKKRRKERGEEGYHRY